MSPERRHRRLQSARRIEQHDAIAGADAAALQLLNTGGVAGRALGAKVQSSLAGDLRPRGGDGGVIDGDREADAFSDRREDEPIAERFRHTDAVHLGIGVGPRLGDLVRARFEGADDRAATGRLDRNHARQRARDPAQRLQFLEALQLDHVGDKALFVFFAPWNVALCGAMLTKHATGTAFRNTQLVTHLINATPTTRGA